MQRILDRSGEPHPKHRSMNCFTNGSGQGTADNAMQFILCEREWYAKDLNRTATMRACACSEVLCDLHRVSTGDANARSLVHSPFMLFHSVQDTKVCRQALGSQLKLAQAQS